MAQREIQTVGNQSVVIVREPLVYQGNPHLRSPQKVGINLQRVGLVRNRNLPTTLNTEMMSGDHNYNKHTNQTEGASNVMVSMVDRNEHMVNTTSPSSFAGHKIIRNTTTVNTVTPPKENQIVRGKTDSHQVADLNGARPHYVSPTFQYTGSHKKAVSQVNNAPTNIGTPTAGGKCSSPNVAWNNNKVYPAFVRHHDDIIALIKTVATDKNNTLIYYQCNFCNYGISNATDRQDIVKHVEVTHTIKCPWCEYRARTRSRIYHHHLEAHADNKQFLANRGLALAVKEDRRTYEQVPLFVNTKSKTPLVGERKNHASKDEDMGTEDDLLKVLLANHIENVDDANIAIDLNLLPSESDIEEAEKLSSSGNSKAPGQSEPAKCLQEEPEIEEVSEPCKADNEEELLACHCCNVMLSSDMFHRIHLLVAHKLVVDDNGRQLFLVADKSIREAVLATQASTKQSWAGIPDLDIKLGLERRDGAPAMDELMQIAMRHNLQHLVDIREVLIQWFQSIEGQRPKTSAASESTQVPGVSTNVDMVQNGQALQDGRDSSSPPGSHHKWACSYCPFTAGENSEVVNHIVNSHPNTAIRIKQLFADEADQAAQSVGEQPVKGEAEKPLFCYYCGHSGYEMEVLSSHIQTVHPGEKFLVTMSMQPVHGAPAPIMDENNVEALKGEYDDVGAEVMIEEEVEDDEKDEEEEVAGLTANSESDSEVPDTKLGFDLAQVKLKKEKEELLKSTLLEMETALDDTTRHSTRKQHSKRSKQLSDFIWSEDMDELVTDSRGEESSVGGDVSVRVTPSKHKVKKKRGRRNSPPDTAFTPQSRPSRGVLALRKQRCRQCVNCLRDDCQECNFCIDMVKFGGSGKMKQGCAFRKCLNPNRFYIGSIPREERGPLRRPITRINQEKGKLVGKYMLNSVQQDDFVFEQEKSPFDTGKNFYQCPYCSRTSSVKQDLISHMTFGHPATKIDRAEIKKFRKPASSNDSKSLCGATVKTKKAVIKLVPLERFRCFASLKDVFKFGEAERLNNEFQKHGVESIWKGTCGAGGDLVNVRKTKPQIGRPKSKQSSTNRVKPTSKVNQQEFIKRSMRRRRQNVANVQEMKIKYKLDQAESTGLMERVSVSVGPQVLGVMETKYKCTRCPFITRTTDFMCNHISFAHGTSTTANDGDGSKAAARKSASPGPGKKTQYLYTDSADDKAVERKISEEMMMMVGTSDTGNNGGDMATSVSPKQYQRTMAVAGKSGKLTHTHGNSERTLSFEDF